MKTAVNGAISTWSFGVIEAVSSVSLVCSISGLLRHLKIYLDKYFSYDQIFFRELPREPGHGGGGRVHGPEQQREVLPGAALQHQQEQRGGADQEEHRPRRQALLQRRRGVRRVSVRHRDLRPVAQLQQPQLLAPGHRLQDPARLQPPDIQQPRVRQPARPVRQPGLRGGVRPGADVHHQDQLREGLGRGVPPQDRDGHPLLDRGAPERAPAVAGQGADADGLPLPQVRVQQLDFLPPSLVQTQ